MKKKEIFITIIGIIIICVLISNKVLQNDTFYTIKVGESILKHGIDMKDHFSFHVLGYSYPHYLYDIIIYLIYSALSFKGLYLFNIITFIGLMLIYYYINLRLFKRETLVSIVTVVVITLISGYVVVRAQSISYMLFLMEIYSIRCLLDTGKKRYSIYLSLIALLICNMHIAVYPFYFILYLPYVGEWFITKFKGLKVYKFVNKKIEIKKEKNIKKLFITLGISLFMGLFTPLGEYPYTYFIRTSLGKSQSYIAEHGMIGFSTFWIVIFLIISFMLLIFFIVKSKKRIRIIDIFMILGLELMSVMSQRHFALFIILGSINLIGMFECYLDNGNYILNMLFDSKIFLGIVIIEIMIIGIVKFSFNINKDYIDREKYPVEAAMYIKDNYDINKLRVFNEYNFGSYLLLADIKVFIDSRADLYTREFSGLNYDIFDDYMDIMKGDLEKLDSYNVDLCLLYKNNFLNEMLKSNYKYIRVYDDKYFVMYEVRE